MTIHSLRRNHETHKIASIRDAHYPDRPNSHLTIGTVDLVYALLGDVNFSAVYDAVRTGAQRERRIMRNRRFSRLALFLISVLLSGCAAVPFLPFIPMMGSAYDGYAIWKSGTATKYYPFDLDITYRAVRQASDQLKIEATLKKTASMKGYSLETKGAPMPMHIDILPLEKSEAVTKVVIRISMFGDKQYVGLFYRLVDDNLYKKAAMNNEKTQ